jgi:hypothetical protein
MTTQQSTDGIGPPPPDLLVLAILPMRERVPIVSLPSASTIAFGVTNQTRRHRSANMHDSPPGGRHPGALRRAAPRAMFVTEQ